MDRPIIFSAPMVNALIAGTKTQTRRILKPQPETFSIDNAGTQCEVALEHMSNEPLPRVRLGRVITLQQVRCAIGDRLWVREGGEILTAAVSYNPHTHQDVWSPVGWRHAADKTIVALAEAGDIDSYIDDCSARKRPSIHMPRWASRLTLEVVDVKVERLHDISETDAKAEGIEVAEHDDDRWIYPIPGTEEYAATARGAYQEVWEGINGRGSWEANPWICAITFRVIRANINKIWNK